MCLLASLLVEVRFWFVFKVTLSLPPQSSSLPQPAGRAAATRPRHGECQWDTSANFSHGVGVTRSGARPPEMHMSTTSAILEVCCSCPPNSFPHRVPPLILILPIAIGCGVSFSHFHRNTLLMLEVQIIIYGDFYPPVKLQKLLAGLHNAWASCFPAESKFHGKSILTPKSEESV